MKLALSRTALAVAGALLALTTTSSAESIFLEAAPGQFVGEAEHYSSRTSDGAGRSWLVVPDESSPAGPLASNARGGQYIQSLPDGSSNQAPLLDPQVTYTLQIESAGTYQLYVRWDGNDTSDTSRGQSDSLFADVVELKDGNGGPIADWYEMNHDIDADFSTDAWDAGGEAEADEFGPSDNPMVWDIPSAGLYTLRFTVREDGSSIDAWVFQLTTLDAPSGTGPAESPIVPEPATMSLLGMGGLALLRRKRRA